jgi:hypothetical protein
MPIDWGAIDAAIEDAGKKTDDLLAARISSVTRLTDDEIKSLFPTPADVERLAELMKIVRASTAEREKINLLVSNIDSLAGPAIKLLAKFA